MPHHQDDHTDVIHVRPRFEVTLPFSIQDVELRLRSALNAQEVLVLGKVQNGFARFMLPLEEQHYWSPQLTINMQEDEGGTFLRGMYGPKPTVWTLFVFFYSFIGIAMVFIAIFGSSYIALGKSGAILWLIPFLLLVFLSLYLVSFFGQRLGRDQIRILHDFVEDALDVEL
ncbi:MAG: hypothetical protein HKN09_07500 [Saprospiraceae bacterium]|nr:hypothetical protein [Saprospiraceae bacterium]